MEHSEELKNMFANVRGAVEANSFEYQTLWANYSEEFYRVFKKTPDVVTKDWQSSRSGLGKEVGKIGERPVFLSLRTAVIDGHKILFYEATSQVVDFEMIENWLKKNLPKSAFRNDGYLNKSDAQNFHSIFHNLKYNMSEAA